MNEHRVVLEFSNLYATREFLVNASDRTGACFVVLQPGLADIIYRRPVRKVRGFGGTP